jgi:predicted transport protein
MLDNLEEKTGKSLETWIEICKKKSFSKHSEIVKFLKEEHGITHGFANTIALKTRETDAGSIDDSELIANQYKGKESLLPIKESLDQYISELGSDIQKAPKKANISYRRKVQFALVQPSTKSRVDLGLKLKGIANEGKLESSGPFGTMCTHRIQLHSAKDIDQEVRDWIAKAYEMAG